MSLSDRLKRAETERLLAAGLVHSEAALKPEPSDVPDRHDASAPGGLFDPITVELHSPGLHPVADTAAIHLDEGEAERGAACPNCRHQGIVDMVDLVGHRTHYSCPTCGTLWQARREAADHAAR